VPSKSIPKEADVDIIKTDVAIIGAGGTGLRAAIAIAEAHPELEIALISKVYPMRSHTVAAEGGAAGVVRDDDSLENHFKFPVVTGCASKTWSTTSSTTRPKRWSNLSTGVAPGAASRMAKPTCARLVE